MEKENTMGNVLNALKEQVKAGFAPKSDDSASLGSRAVIDRPTSIGDLLTRAEEARDDLRHTGYSR